MNAWYYSCCLCVRYLRGLDSPNALFPKPRCTILTSTHIIVYCFLGYGQGFPALIKQTSTIFRQSLHHFQVLTVSFAAASTNFSNTHITHCDFIDTYSLLRTNWDYQTQQSIIIVSKSICLSCLIIVLEFTCLMHNLLLHYILNNIALLQFFHQSLYQLCFLQQTFYWLLQKSCSMFCYQIVLNVLIL